MHVNAASWNRGRRKCVFVGYPENVKGYKLWCPKSGKFIISRDVIFNEAEMIRGKDAHELRINDTVHSEVEHDESENVGNEIPLSADGFKGQTRDQLAQADQNRSEPDSSNPTRVDEEESNSIRKRTS